LASTNTLVYYATIEKAKYADQEQTLFSNLSVLQKRPNLLNIVPNLKPNLCFRLTWAIFGLFFITSALIIVSTKCKHLFKLSLIFK
jgi:hypothetical protein